MATVPTYFKDFLSNIRMTKSQNDDCAKGHAVLRDRLANDDDLKDIVIDTFLQGSYKRHTAIKPVAGEGKSDVDVIVVTNLDHNKVSPSEALERFHPFLKKHYAGKFRRQGRSWGIELSYVDLDLVITSAPSEVAKEEYRSFYLLNEAQLINVKSEWQSEPLLIPDREVGRWDKTHPLAQILATLEKNRNTNGHYINVVKSIKWWRKALHPKPKHPKSYPLEHFIWTVCPNSIQSVAEGIVQTFEHIRDDYGWYVTCNTKPRLPDHGVPEHDVFARVANADFAAFYELVCAAATTARDAYNEQDVKKSVLKWRELFGDEFPSPPTDSSDGDDNSDGGGFTPRQAPSIIGGGRFA